MSPKDRKCKLINMPEAKALCCQDIADLTVRKCLFGLECGGKKLEKIGSETLRQMFAPKNSGRRHMHDGQ